MLVVKPHGQVVGDLPPHGNHHSLGCFQLHHIHDPFEGKLIEIQAVTDIIISTYCLGIIIDHDRPVSLFVQGIECVDTAPVKFHAAADPVGT